MSSGCVRCAPRRLAAVLAVALAAALLAACSGGGRTAAPAGPSIVVTTSILGAVVRDLVGDAADVTVLMGNGVDPHDWAPSAKDIETVMKADLVVANGLSLEQGFEQTLGEAERAGVAVFRATDHVTVRTVGKAGTGDPHFWVDPIAMRDVVAALVPELAAAGIRVDGRAADLERRLADLDAEVRATLEAVPRENRKLVTGHESLGYFADRYGFEMIGTVIPGLSSQGEVSAGALAALKAAIETAGVRAVFAEVGTPAAVAKAVAAETGARVVELPLHVLPADGSYFTFVRRIAETIAGALA